MKFLFFLAQVAFLISQAQVAGAIDLVRITTMSVYDNLGTTASPAVDVVQDVCSVSDEEIIREPSTDVLLTADVKNATSKTLFVGSFKYKVKNRGDGRRLTTKALAAVSPVEIAPGETKTVQFLFIRASEGKKYFYGSDVPITSLGFTNVEVQVITKDASRTKRILKKKTALSFGNFDNCN